MFAIDGTLLVIFFSFLIFMMVLRSLFFEPVAQIKKTRVAAVKTATQAAESAGHDRTTAAETYAARIREAQQQALLSVQAKREEARQKAASHVAQARSAALSRVESQTDALRGAQESAYAALESEKQGYVAAIIAKLSAGQTPASVGAPQSSPVL